MNGIEHCIDDEILYKVPLNWNFTRQMNVCWLDNGIKSIGEKLPYLEAKVIRGLKEPVYKTNGIIVDSDCKLILVDGENSGEIMIPPYKGYLGSTFKILESSSYIYSNYLTIIFEINKN